MNFIESLAYSAQRYDFFLYLCSRMKKKFITKKRFLFGFFAVTVVLALVRLIFPEVTQDKISHPETAMTEDSAQVVADAVESVSETQSTEKVASGRFFDGKHPIMSVPSCREEFSDSQQVQIVAANEVGVSPVQNRAEAEHQKNGSLVYVGSNPYYYVAKLSASIPYLVPKAAVLLQDIGRNMFDSLQVKHIPLHKIIVTSVLRTKDDVAKLQTHNKNATENSCHLYGTTFDISYTKFVTVSDPMGKERRAVRDDTLKFVLSEVLRDLRNQERCYVKYEVKQACFHITTR